MSWAFCMKLNAQFMLVLMKRPRFNFFFSPFFFLPDWHFHNSVASKSIPCYILELQKNSLWSPGFEAQFRKSRSGTTPFFRLSPHLMHENECLAIFRNPRFVRSCHEKKTQARLPFGMWKKACSALFPGLALTSLPVIDKSGNCTSFMACCSQ